MDYLIKVVWFKWCSLVVWISSMCVCMCVYIHLVTKSDSNLWLDLFQLRWHLLFNIVSISFYKLTDLFPSSVAFNFHKDDGRFEPLKKTSPLHSKHSQWGRGLDSAVADPCVAIMSRHSWTTLWLSQPQESRNCLIGKKSCTDGITWSFSIFR